LTGEFFAELDPAVASLEAHSTEGVRSGSTCWIGPSILHSVISLIDALVLILETHFAYPKNSPLLLTLKMR